MDVQATELLAMIAIEERRLEAERRMIETLAHERLPRSRTGDFELLRSRPVMRPSKATA